MTILFMVYIPAPTFTLSEDVKSYVKLGLRYWTDLVNPRGDLSELIKVLLARNDKELGNFIFSNVTVSAIDPENKVISFYGRKAYNFLFHNKSTRVIF